MKILNRAIRGPLQTTFLLALFLGVQGALGAGLGGSNSGAATDIVQSGRDEDVLEINRESARLIDQAVDLLGISRGPHRIEFVPSAQLAHLAVQGRPPVGHWFDGSIIVTQARSAMGVLEFVAPGCPTCRSFYTDSATPVQQREILKHVSGHNDFSIESMYCQIRQPCDMIASAQKLYEFMEEAYKKYDFDEIAQWYQYLLSVAHAQDLVRGTFEAPESMVRDSAKPNSIHPKVPTPHELQFLVTHLPAELPQWKREMAVLFEQTQRMAGYMVTTKIMNEGWATFLQEFLTPYLPWNSDIDFIEYAELRSGVAFPRLSNPYWLGREGWRNLYQNFKKRKDVSNLSDLERDRKFVELAHQLIATSSDYEFLRTSLNSDWVAKHHLFLYRKAQGDEVDPNLIPPPGLENPELKTVVSTDADQVIRAIATRLSDRSRHFPQIVLENENSTGKNILSLLQIGPIPLKKETLAPALFVRTQIWRRPVSLKTIASPSWLRKRAQAPWMALLRQLPGITTSLEETEEDWVKEDPRIRIEVSPDGQVQVFRGHSFSPSEPHGRLTQIFQRSVDRFRDELEGSYHQKLEEGQRKRFASEMSTSGSPRFEVLKTEVIDQATHASMSLISHSPTSASAILRYYEMVEKRLMNSIQRAMTGKSHLKRTQKGARIQVLPSIPELELDQTRRQQMEKEEISQIFTGRDPDQDTSVPRDLSALVQKNVQSVSSYFNQLAFAGIDLGGKLPGMDIGSKDHAPKKGDRFWGEGENENQGKGSGDDDEDSDDDEANQGEEEPGDGEAGQGGDVDPTEIDIPLELIGEFLKVSIELPRLRPLAGYTFKNDRERDGAQSRPYGDILWNRVVPKALVLGEIAAKKRGLDPKSVDRRDLLKEGIKRIHPGDWVVPATQKVPLPDTQAVVVIWMDMTGSMMGQPIQMAKQFMFNFKALLSTKYKNVVFRYVGFSDTAMEFPTERSFFKGFLGGGTLYSSGIQMTQKILNEYPDQNFDKYSFGIGDAEDFNPTESGVALREMIEQTRYSAFIQTDVGGFPNPQFISLLQGLADDDEYFGFGVLKAAKESSIEVLQHLFGKRG